MCQFINLQIDQHIASKKNVVQNQINMKMLRSDYHMNLPADESETAPHLKKELLKMID